MTARRLRRAGLACLLPIGLAAAAGGPGTVSDMRPQNAGRPWSVQSRGGVTRFEVRPGDRWGADGDQPKERSEIYVPRLLVVGGTYRIGFGLMVEPGDRNSADWMLLMQIQSTFRKGDPGHSPPLALELRGERLRIVSRTSPIPRAQAADIVFTNHYTDRDEIERGRWYAYSFDVHLDPLGNGLLRVSRDGRQLMEYRGPIGFVEPVGPYVKTGIYRASAPEALAVRFKDLTIAPIRPD